MKLSDIVKEQEESVMKPPLIPRVMVYGDVGKTSLFGGLSEFTGKTVIELSPRGSSSTEEFPNFITVPVDDLEDLRNKFEDIKKGLKAIKQTARNLDSKEYLKKLKNSKRVDGDFVLKWAKKGEYPIAAVIISEFTTIANWVELEVKNSLSSGKVIGDDKKSMGMDWSKLRQAIMKEFHYLSSVEVMSAFLVNHRFSKDSYSNKHMYSILPNICQGAASNEIIDDLDGLYHSYQSDGKYKVTLLDKTQEKRVKQKLASVYESNNIKNEIDITNNPEKLWEYVEKMNKIKKQNKK